MTNNGDSLNVNNCEEVAEAACESAEGIVADRLGRFAMPEQIGSVHIELLCEHGHNGIPGLGTPGEPVDQQDCLRVVRLMRRAHPADPTAWPWIDTWWIDTWWSGDRFICPASRMFDRKAAVFRP